MIFDKITYMNLNDIRNRLSAEFDRDDKKHAYEKQIVNIEAFSSLDRTGLEFGVIERRLLLYTTEQGEKIYIQYPGKETKNSDQAKIRPWDFRPKVLNKNGEWMKDQSFKDIWDEIDSLNKYDDVYLSLIAALFFRCSMLLDTKKVTEEYEYEDFDKVTGQILRKGKLTMTWYKLMLDEECIDYIEQKVPTMGGGFSTKAYLIMNDLLCQNEDCKYFYRDTEIRGTAWGGKVGRHNTYRTHVSIIDYHEGNITFSEIMDMFQRGSGVAPITDSKIEEATDGLIKKKANNR